MIVHDGSPLAPVSRWLRKSPHVWLVCPDLPSAWTSLNRHTRQVQAAGGLLTNQKGELLCIHRRGHWDLPKGKVESGEELDEAAAREVHEECGVPLPIVGDKMAITHHVFGKKDKQMKVTHWFHMTPAPGTDDVKLTPQVEEDIREVRWADSKEVARLEPKAFGNIARLMAAWRANQ